MYDLQHRKLTGEGVGEGVYTSFFLSPSDMIVIAPPTFIWSDFKDCSGFEIGNSWGFLREIRCLFISGMLNLAMAGGQKIGVKLVFVVTED